MGEEPGVVAPSVAATAKRPEPLTGSEKLWQLALFITGALLILGILVWFGLSTDGGGLTSQVSESTEPVGGGTGTKETTTTNYADTVVIFALTLGGALILAAAFYGRLRELKLGGLTLGLGELPPDQQEKLDKKTEQVITRSTDDEDKQRVLKAAAQRLARERFYKQYWGVRPRLPEADLNRIAEDTAQEVLRATGE